MCSLRSCPVQNARPEPVRTTHRAAGSSATFSMTSRSNTLVAMSRLFIASGRLRVIVAMPSVTSSRTGAVMRLSLSGQTPVDEAVRARLQPRGLPGEATGGLVSGPVLRQQLRGQAGVGEQELPPFVHQVEASRERRLVGLGVLVVVLLDQVSRGRQPLVVRRTEGCEVPCLDRVRMG